ncbi:dapper 1 [Crotalus adamanteus]|uniref:Dapper 1 n=1 Tax=Crotalus adamanteus TaxID=8729 RepID=A0AAW1C6M0_CROAD
MKASPEPGKQQQQQQPEQQQQQQQGQVAAAAAGKEPDPRWARDGARSEATDAERLRTRERLEATLAGLAELEFLRQRQELRVKRLLAAAPSASLAGSCSGETTRAVAGAGVAPRSLEEKFLEENILLLRRQLNCLRRRDAGLLNQLQELDKQISDLRLDVEKTTDEHLDMDSRPSSGFYELSDGASGSLSNSSNSVFSECLSSCHSSTCFCSSLDASLSGSDGRPKSADFISWLEQNKGIQQNDQAGVASPSMPQSDSFDIVADVHPKYQCDLVSKNGNDVYRYPSPLHAVAVQSPMFLLPVTSCPPREVERTSDNAVDVEPELSSEKTVDSCQESRPLVEFKSEGSSFQSLEEGLLVNAQFIPAQPQTVRLHKGTRSVKILKGSMVKHKSHLVTVLENGPQTGREKAKSVGKKCHFLDELDTNKKPRKTTLRGKKGLHLQPDANHLSRQPGVLKSVLRPHGHSREPVVAKPKHKRADYRHWKLSAEVSYEDALRRARRNRREAGGVYSQVPHPYISPYAYVASDSEYSAECESLFHSTVVDTSEDERSNYTTNCFGDSESSLSGVEFVGESTTTSDSEESGGLLWSQFVQTLPIQAVAAASELHENAAKAFVKIKASHNLKKKILRFRSGSLKLMTTV